MTTGWKQTDKLHYLSNTIRKTRKARHGAHMGKVKE